MRRALKKVGVALDIDGVLLRGYNPIPGAKEALEHLHQHAIPHVFLTNGGGILEQEKAAQLSNIFQLPILEKQIILAHTPMQSLVPTFGDQKVLILGSKDVHRVAKSYGFQKVVSMEDVAQHNPTQYPFIDWEYRECPLAQEPFAAIMVFYDPIHWAPELQIALDILQSHPTQTPLFVSNMDFTFSGEYPTPRLAQGAFTMCLQLLYEKLTSKALEVTAFGKPSAMTYAFAQDRLMALSEDTAAFDCIYGIGDNPLSDIQGANGAGEPWTSILVRTGIFEGTNDPTYPAQYVCDSVTDAMQWIRRQH